MSSYGNVSFNVNKLIHENGVEIKIEIFCHPLDLQWCMSVTQDCPWTASTSVPGYGRMGICMVCVWYGYGGMEICLVCGMGEWKSVLCLVCGYGGMRICFVFGVWVWGNGNLFGVVWVWGNRNLFGVLWVWGNRNLFSVV